MKTARRLRSETFSATVGRGHEISITVCRDNIGAVCELVIAGRGRPGAEIDQLFMDLGVAISRCIGGRDPNTGAEIVDTKPTKRALTPAEIRALFHAIAEK